MSLAGGRRQEYAKVGSRTPRTDSAAFVSAKARFATDLTLPGMLHCRLLYSSQAHARILDIDVSDAVRLPGVEAVVTAADAPPMNLTGMSIAGRALLAGSTVRSVADVVAAVAAVDEETAQRAVERIKVRYEDLPAVFSLETALAENAPLVHDAKDHYHLSPWLRHWAVLEPGNVSSHFRLQKGDVDRGKSRSHLIVRDRFRTQRMEHFSMESHAAVVSYDPATDRLTVWSSSGKPFRTLAQLASLLNLPMNRINVIYMPTGGDFGGKGEITVEPYCAMLSMRTGRPVKCVYSREEEFFAATCKTPFDIDLAIGVDRDGLILFMEGDLGLDTGAYNSMPAMVSVHAATHLEGPYNVPNIVVGARCVYTHNVMSGSFRGFGTPQVTFARESLLDEVAKTLRVDPVELRLRNAWTPGAITCTGQRLDPAMHTVDVRDTIIAAAQSSHWAARKAEFHRAGGADAKQRGIGIATAHHGLGGASFLGADTATTFVKPNPDGTVMIISGASDVGQGIDTALSQIVGEALGLPRSAIGIAFKSTDGVPQDLGASASRTMYAVGNATRSAALDLREKLVRVTARMLEADPHDIECNEGRLFVRGAPGRALAFDEVVAYSMRKLGEQPFGIGTHRGRGVPLNEQAQGDSYQTFDYATQVAEVEVDMETGEVHVQRLVNAQDVGKAVNPLIVEGQLEGGMVMGLGFALMEEVICRDGHVANPYAFDYRTPRAGDVPDIETVILEHGDPTGPYGAKGVGEICMNPTAAAIANAIADATGIRVTSLPITPEKVARALGFREG
ncbi:MAG TPA: xanthine dehydrogenase family protein molybdopterin-binding subunit [bacterium]|nr:xanthine dehydrogenase family protein molybdopterin-binding subunit [bacterium]